jgi:hypothetical protein
MELTGNRNQCQGCKQYFNSNSGFDMHRTGDYHGHRRCLNVDEMLEIGMSKNSKGFWITEKMDASRIEEQNALRQQTKTV